jgi:hypothetical protein
MNMIKIIDLGFITHHEVVDSTPDFSPLVIYAPDVFSDAVPDTILSSIQ